MVSKSKEHNKEHLPDGDLKDKDFDLAEHEFQSHILTAKSQYIAYVR